MKLELYKDNPTSATTTVVEGNRITFGASQPLVIQPGEIMSVQTEMFVRIEDGFVLNISTCREISQRAGELFPGLITIDSEDEILPIQLPIKNSGRSTLHIMPGDRIAVGYVTRAHPIEAGEFVPLSKPGEDTSKRLKTVPQKKNSRSVKFEIT